MLIAGSIGGNMALYAALLVGFLVLRQALAQEVPFVVNLSGQCLRCLCYAASRCNLTVGCDSGYCGPYKISRIYWKDSGEVTLPDDEKERSGAYEDCALSYHCAQKIVKGYLVKYGRDCNNDGVTDCDDFSMINFNGGYRCAPPLGRNEAGRSWLERYRICNPETRL